MDPPPPAQSSSAPPPPLPSSATPPPSEQPPPQPQSQSQAQTQTLTQAQAPSPSPYPPLPSPATTVTTTTTSSPSLPPPTTRTPPPLPSTTTSSSPSLPPSTNPTPTPAPTTQPLQPRPTTTTLSRPWQQPSPYMHFSLPPSPTPPLPSSTSPSPPSVSSAPRGGMAIGVPAHHPTTPPQPPTSFSSINPQKFGGLGRNVPDSIPTSSTSQVRQPIQGMGMMGSLGSGSAMRPAGVPGHQFRPGQSSLRPPNSPGPQSPNTQNFQGHGMLRVQSVGSSGSSSPNTAQSPQPQNQPWLSSASQGKPPLPPPSLRPQMSPQSLQQRSHVPLQQQQQQQHPTIPTTAQQQQTSSSQQVQQPSTSSQPQEQIGQHYAPPRVQPSVPHQQQMARGQALGIQRPSSHGIMQSGLSQAGAPSRTSGEDTGELCNRILSKRTIQELLTQIDPSEKLDPEVEDVLVDIAEEFVDSITTFGCSLAKHRKSTVLESKDILLHLERNWNMTLPGFSGDEIKTYRKPLMNDIHRERLAVIKKSIVAGEANSRSSAGQAGGNTKSHLAKGPANILGSPNPKIREAA